MFYKSLILCLIEFHSMQVVDVLEIITVLSARLYGARNRKNQKLLDALKKQ
jgi:predicted site-specific integrase-resolvase